MSPRPVAAPSPSPPLRPLPWPEGVRPLMLAPMQGLTNRALRASVVARGRPDVVFTEFVRVQAGAKGKVSRTDLDEIRLDGGEVPLVVQLIGHGAEGMAAAARTTERAGAAHFNLNLGCPYGRMTSGATGGALLREPEALARLLGALRPAVPGTFSIKCRAGYDDPGQVFELLSIFEESGVDFLVLHPRTVEQRFRGEADHDVSARLIERTRLPVIVNGDVRTAAAGRALLAATGAAGLMIGRGALADPWLFRRLRGEAPGREEPGARRAQVRDFVDDVLRRYLELFGGERAALMKVKDVLGFVPDPDLEDDLRRLKRAKTLERFLTQLDRLAA